MVMTVRLPYLADTMGPGPSGLPSLDVEPELSFAQLGLSDTLLADGQYGQTLTVSFRRIQDSQDSGHQPPASSAQAYIVPFELGDMLCTI